MLSTRIVAIEGKYPGSILIWISQLTGGTEVVQLTTFSSVEGFRKLCDHAPGVSLKVSNFQTMPSAALRIQGTTVVTASGESVPYAIRALPLGHFKEALKEPAYGFSDIGIITDIRLPREYKYSFRCSRCGSGVVRRCPRECFPRGKPNWLPSKWG